MCGIFGLIDTPWRSSAAAGLQALSSRGPDAHTFEDVGGAVFGHTRLAIIDLEYGTQPMRSVDGRYILVFNGEIYNFQQLRHKLEAQGCIFTTNSDTEVLLHGFITWGASLVPLLNGMFSFAVWDIVTRTLFAARDRMGIKPFFYSTVAGFSFASTVAPFLRLTGFPRTINYEALRDYLAFQTPLAPHSFLLAVKQLPPASQLIWCASSNKLTIQRYWDIPHPTPLVTNVKELVEQVDLILAASVRRQLVAEVPLGAFLSGGIDSSLVIHYMAQAGTKPLKTFSMRFAQQRIDESPYAKAVAEQYCTEHHVIDAPNISGRDFVTAIQTLDQPLADPAYVSTYALAQVTKSEVTVAMSGDGGDELFGGYADYQKTEDLYPQHRGQKFLRRMIQFGFMPSSLFRSSLYGQERLFYNRVELGPWPESHKNFKRYLIPNALERCVPERTLELWRNLAVAFGGRMDTASLMRADLWTYLAENCLVKTDRASMAHGLEVRVPMLDNDVLDIVLQFPAHVHYGVNNQDKFLLRTLAQRYLPKVVWNRPKQGFAIPIRQLFHGAWQEAIEDVLGRIEEVAPFLNAAEVRSLWRAVHSKRGSRRLAYTFIVLLLWLDQHQIEY